MAVQGWGLHDGSPESELFANYAELREQRGWSWQQIANHVRSLGGNADLADALESRGAGDKSARGKASGTERAVKGAPERRA